MAFFLFTLSLTPGGFVAAGSAWAVWPWDGPAVTAFIGYVALLGVMVRQRSIQWPYVAWCAGTIAVIVGSSSVAPSVGRYAMMAIPFVWLLARSRWRAWIAGLSALALAVLGAGAFAEWGMP